LRSHSGADQELAHIAADISGNFEKQSADETEKIILSRDIRAYVGKKQKEKKNTGLAGLIKLVARDYEDRKVSVSLLNNFFECPWKWYFRNLLQLPEPKSESLEFGNIVHGSVDGVLKLTKKPSEKDLQNIISKEVRKTGFGDDRKQKELFKLALKIVSKWADARLREISKEKENEQSISVSDDRFPNLNIYGKIDLIEHLDSKNVRVTDFKTGNVRKKSEIEKIDPEGRMSTYMRQLAMYSYLIRQSPKWKVGVGESRLEFLEAKKNADIFYNTVIDNEQIDMIVKDITDYDNLLKSGEWVNRPCNYNSYGKNTECEYCKMAEIYK
jgi:CRISPR/Cas system-associated exonuclease Cas4 (RecB family)